MLQLYGSTYFGICIDYLVSVSGPYAKKNVNLIEDDQQD